MEHVASGPRSQQRKLSIGLVTIVSHPNMAQSMNAAPIRIA